jgi:hypothetical protein
LVKESDPLFDRRKPLANLFGPAPFLRGLGRASNGYRTSALRAMDDLANLQIRNVQLRSAGCTSSNMHDRPFQKEADWHARLRKKARLRKVSSRTGNGLMALRHDLDCGARLGEFTVPGLSDQDNRAVGVMPWRVVAQIATVFVAIYAMWRIDRRARLAAEKEDRKPDAP